MCNVAEKDTGFLRIGSLNVRVKKTTEAFSNFLGVGGGSINSIESTPEKMHKGWGSADNITQVIHVIHRNQCIYISLTFFIISRSAETGKA